MRRKRRIAKNNGIVSESYTIEPASELFFLETFHVPISGGPVKPSEFTSETDVSGKPSAHS